MGNTVGGVLGSDVAAASLPDLASSANPTALEASPCPYCKQTTQYRACTLREAQSWTTDHHIFGVEPQTAPCEQMHCTRPACKDPNARVHYLIDDHHAARICKHHVSAVYICGQLISHAISCLPFLFFLLSRNILGFEMVGWWLVLHLPVWRFDPFELGALLHVSVGKYQRLALIYVSANVLSFLAAGLFESFAATCLPHLSVAIIMAASLVPRQGPFTGAMARWNRSAREWQEQGAIAGVLVAVGLVLAAVSISTSASSWSSMSPSSSTYLASNHEPSIDSRFFIMQVTGALVLGYHHVGDTHITKSQRLALLILYTMLTLVGGFGATALLHIISGGAMWLKLWRQEVRCEELYRLRHLAPPDSPIRARAATFAGITGPATAAKPLQRHAKRPPASHSRNASNDSNVLSWQSGGAASSGGLLDPPAPPQFSGAPLTSSHDGGGLTRSGGTGSGGLALLSRSAAARSKESASSSLSAPTLLLGGQFSPALLKGLLWFKQERRPDGSQPFFRSWKHAYAVVRHQTLALFNHNNHPHHHHHHQQSSNVEGVAGRSLESRDTQRFEGANLLLQIASVEVPADYEKRPFVVRVFAAMNDKGRVLLQLGSQDDVNFWLSQFPPPGAVAMTASHDAAATAGARF